MLTKQASEGYKIFYINNLDYSNYDIIQKLIQLTQRLLIE